MKNLKKFVRNTWDGDVTYREAIEGFTHSELLLMEKALKEDQRVNALVSGLPEDFKPFSKGEKLLQKMVDNID